MASASACRPIGGSRGGASRVDSGVHRIQTDAIAGDRFPVERFPVSLLDEEQGSPMVAEPMNDTRGAAPALAAPAVEPAREPLRPRRRPLIAQLWRYRTLYLMALPGIVYFLVFKYVPMGGLIVSFQDYKPFLGIAGSPWVGFEHFVRLFTQDTFMMLLRNTLVLSFLLMLISFPVPIILALLLNELRGIIFKRGIQTIIYIPHFMSWVIVVSLFYVMLTTDGGAINNLIVAAGGEPIGFLTEPDWLRPMYVFQHVWRTAGWGTIVYLAALTAVDMSLYEARSEERRVGKECRSGRGKRQ